MKKRILDFSSDEQRTIMLDICNRIYMARNITLSEETILDELKKIDCLFRNGGYNDEDEC
jgi:hypothetical protein